jgi:CDP-6-deoxy-D-xylo-4-hexulose-3-dehydrase
VAARRRNWQHLRDGLIDLEEHLVLPEATPGCEPSWFGFAITVRPEAPFSRFDLVQHLESHRIATRQLFGGNLMRQPAYLDMPHRAVGPMPNADIIMDGTFWIGVYPALTGEMLDYMVEAIHGFAGSANSR